MIMQKYELKRFFFFLLLIISALVVWNWAQSYSARLFSENLKHFDSANIKGVIILVEIKNKAAGVKVDNNEGEFIFTPYVNKKLNDGRIFTSFAKIGDSLKKKAYSDTLELIKSGKSYKYTFRRAG